MAKAIWNGVTIAESNDIALVEGNAYFPTESVAWDHLRKSGETDPTYCHWKGFASYYDIVAHGMENKSAVWTPMFFKSRLPAVSMPCHRNMVSCVRDSANLR